jgi:hypothetical protein
MPVILATKEAEMEESQIEASLGKKVMKTPISTYKSWVWWPVPIIQARQEV